MAPVSIKAPTITKRAKINKIISHSILDKISSTSFGLIKSKETNPAAKATVELSMLSSW